jgi:DNA repair exonuclease SbcCD ATPase subunit
MSRIVCGGFCLLLLVSGSVQALRADEAEALLDQARALTKEAAALAEQGRQEETEAHQRRALKLQDAAAARVEKKTLAKKADGRLEAEIARQQAERDVLEAQLERLVAAQAPDEAMGELKQRIAATDKLLQVLKLKQKDQAVASLQKAEKRAVDKQSLAKLDEVARRIKHLHVAADHLRAAGAGDLAEQLLEKVAAMEEEARSFKAQLAGEPTNIDEAPTKPGQVEHQLEELREQVKQLRAEVAELREQLKR